MTRRRGTTLLWILPSAMVAISIAAFTVVVPGRYGFVGMADPWMLVSTLANLIATPLLTAGMLGFVIAIATNAILWNRRRAADVAAASAALAYAPGSSPER